MISVMRNLETRKRTKGVLSGASVLIYLIILNVTASWAQGTVGPKMVIEEKQFDAKQVKEGDVIRHTFTVQNTGDQPLQIKRVQPG